MGRGYFLAFFFICKKGCVGNHLFVFPVFELLYLCSLWLDVQILCIHVLLAPLKKLVYSEIFCLLLSEFRTSDNNDMAIILILHALNHRHPFYYL
jgi:hypothetical protein